jgi:hypothetical protein
VPVVLDFLSPHYNRWHDLVLLTLERYALADHVLSTAPRLARPSWQRMDCVVLSWHPHCRTSGHCSRTRRLCSRRLGWHRGTILGQP